MATQTRTPPVTRIDALRHQNWADPLENLVLVAVGIAVCAAIDPGATRVGLAIGIIVRLAISAPAVHRRYRQIQRRSKKRRAEGERMPVLRATLEAASVREHKRHEAQWNDWCTRRGYAPIPKLIKWDSTPLGELLEIQCRGGNATSEILIKDAGVFRRDLVGSPCFGVDVHGAPDGGGRVFMRIQRRDITRMLLGTHPVVSAPPGFSILSGVEIGRNDSDEPVRIRTFESSLLAGGQPGSGKSTLLLSIAAHAALASDALLLFIDMKGGVEGAFWRDVCWRYAETADEARALMEEVRSIRLRRRRHIYGNARKVSISPSMPLLVVVCDEMGELDDDTLGLFRTEMGLGRAFGIMVVGATQDPLVDIIPTVVRSKFRHAAAFKTRSSNESNVIQGPGMAGLGYDASKLPEFGVAYVSGVSERPADRVRTFDLSDDLVSSIVARAAPGKAELHALVQTQPWVGPSDRPVDTPTEAPRAGAMGSENGGVESENADSSDSGGPTTDPIAPDPPLVSREPVETGHGRESSGGESSEGATAPRFDYPEVCDRRPAWKVVWRMLVASPTGARPIEIQQRGSVKPSSCHEALKAFVAAGLVEKRPDGRYSIRGGATA